MAPLATAPAGDACAPASQGSRWVCLACGWAVVVLSVTVLLGWALGVTALQRVAPGLPEMTPDTAVGLGCAGLALVWSTPGSRRIVMGRCLGGIAGVIGLLVIFEYLVAPVGIDQLLFHDAGAVDPGRPSPQTAVALAALGLTFASSGLARLPGWVHQACLALSAAVATSAVVGYSYDVDYLRGVSGSDGMAVHTLVGVILLTIGALALHPDRGLLGMMRGHGGSAIMARVVVPLGCAPLAVGASLFALQRHGVVGVRLAMSLFSLLMVALVVVILVVVTVLAQRADARAHEVSQRLRAVFDHVPAAISLRDLDGRFVDLNQAAAAIIGRSVTELIGEGPGQLAMSTAILDDDLAVSRSREPVAHETRLRHADGRLIDYQLIRYPVLDHHGELFGFGTFAFDITERKRTIAELELAQTRFRATFEEAPIGMAVLSLDGRFEQVNDALCGILGRSREHLTDTNSAALMDHDDLRASQSVRRSLLDGEVDSHTIESHYRHADGYMVVVDVHLAVLRGGDGVPQNFLAQVQDITERSRDHAHLTHLADHDPLTGVPNRRVFERALAQQIAHAPRRGATGSLMVIDLDQFKQINDTFGHQAGDELIVHIARLLRRQLRATDVIARLGGDEFGVLLPETTLADTVSVGEGLLETLRASTPPIAGLHRPISASIGVASLGDYPAADADDLLRSADQAMYEAKTSGRDQLCVRSPEPVGSLLAHER